MTNTISGRKRNSQKLLTPKERKTCGQFSEERTDIIAQRAKALLAIDAGTTQAVAAERSGLTIYQVRYLLKIFKQKRLSIFPPLTPPKQREEPAAKKAEVKPEQTAETKEKPKAVIEETKSEQAKPAPTKKKKDKKKKETSSKKIKKEKSKKKEKKEKAKRKEKKVKDKKKTKKKKKK